MNEFDKVYSKIIHLISEDSEGYAYEVTFKFENMNPDQLKKLCEKCIKPEVHKLLFDDRVSVDEQNKTIVVKAVPEERWNVFKIIENLKKVKGLEDPTKYIASWKEDGKDADIAGMLKKGQGKAL